MVSVLKNPIVLVSYLTMILAGIVGCGSPSLPSDGDSEASQEKLPYVTPEVSLASIKEARELIDAELGSIVVVNLWATWCPPCVREMPQLAKFYTDFKERVSFLSFSGDLPQALDETVRPFINSYEIPFPVRVLYVTDQDKVQEELKLDWDGSLPSTFVIAPDGTVAERWVGEVTYDMLSEAVAAVEKAESEASTGS